MLRQSCTRDLNDQRSKRRRPAVDPGRRWLASLWTASLWCWAAGCALAAMVGRAPLAAAAEESAAVESLLAGPIAALSDADPEVRGEAAARLAALARTGPWPRERLAAVMQAHLLARETSIEARLLLQQLIKELPIIPPPDDERVTAAEVRALIAELDSPVYQQRLAPQARLFWLAGGVQPACVMVTELKAQFARSSMSESLRQQLETLWNHARWTWLSSPQSRWELPPVSDQDLDGWLTALAPRATNDAQTQQQRRDAERDLIDAMVRDDTRQRASARLAARLDAAKDEEAIVALQELRDWIDRPTIVAEIWRRDVHTGVQHLFVGVPQYPEGGTTATYFDSADEHQAHLASGNVLRPDTYGVGVAFLPPPGSRVERWPGASLFYHLVYQPTAQRRLLYRYELERSQSVRYFEISQRTLRQLADRTGPQRDELATSDAALLLELHPQLVSHYLADEILARWLPSIATVAEDARRDEPVAGGAGSTDADQARDPETSARHLAERAQESFETACAVLLQNGVAVALPALEQAAETPAPLAVRDAAWASALAIAQRETTGEAEHWLERWIEKDTTLGFNDLGGRAPAASDVGATAAAMLLLRAARRPAEFGLAPVASFVPQRLLPPQLGAFYHRLVGYRFTSTQARQQFIAWWRDRDRQPGARAGSGSTAGVAAENSR